MLTKKDKGKWRRDGREMVNKMEDRQKIGEKKREDIGKRDGRQNGRKTKDRRKTRGKI